MIIRPIKKKDNEAMKALIKDSLEKAGLAIPGTAYFDPQLDNLHGFYARNSNSQYWVADMDGIIVGGVGIAPFSGTSICELQKFYVSSDVQGKGIGNYLMETALSFAENHYDSCYLETRKELEAAGRMYRKHEFIPLAEPLMGSEHSAMDAWYIKRFKPLFAFV